MTKKIIHEGRYLRVVRVDNWEYVERTTGKDVAYIIPVYVDNKVPYLIFIKEWRIPIQKYVIGFPAGLVGDMDGGEDIEVAASRELTEETGYSAGRMRLMCSGPPSAGLSDETLHFYLADQLEKVGSGGGDDTESISVYKIPLDEVQTWLDKQSQDEDIVIGPKTYIGLYWIATMIDYDDMDYTDLQ
jgi:ADP-ribose pyrophosphatase